MGGSKAPMPYQPKNSAAVDKGLAANDCVVVKGLQRVKPGSPVEPELTTLTAPEAEKK